MTSWLNRYRARLVAALLTTLPMGGYCSAADGTSPDDRLRQWVYAEHPRLNPAHADHAAVSDWDKVRMLRDFSYRHTAYSNNVQSKAYAAGAAMANDVLSGKRPLVDAYEFFDDGRGGVLCGHTAHLLQRLYALFGYDAWYVGHGFYPATPLGSSFTHAETLVRIRTSDADGKRDLLTLHDPNTNVSYATSAGEPLDYYAMLRLLATANAERISATCDAGEPPTNVPQPLTVCFADETADRQPDDFKASWNIADDYEWRDANEGVWLFRSPRTIAKFDRLGDSLWKPELVQEGLPGETIYIHRLPFEVSGAPGGDDILAKAKAIAAEGHGSTSRNAFPRSGEWPTFRGAPTLAGHLATDGQDPLSAQPAVASRHFVSALVSQVAVEPGGAGQTGRTLRLPDEEAAAAAPGDWRKRWFPTAEQALIGGRTQTMPNDPNMTFADVLPEFPGLERIRFDSGFNLPTHNGRWQYGPGRLEAWSDGEWKTMWETDSIDHCFLPYPMAADFDGDGELEIAALPWRSLLVYDARSGALEQECEFTKGRSYGFIAAADLDSDGRSEFIVMADFAKHVEVLGYRGDSLELLWQYEIELDISNPEKVLRVLPNPLGDVDGDGVIDVVLNLYNDQGDGRWRLVVRDGMTGDVKLELVDEIAQAVVDLDNDGAVELLTMQTVGRSVPRIGNVFVRALRDGTPAAIWSAADVGWEEGVYPVDPLVRDFSRQARHGAVVRQANDRTFAVLRRQRGSDTLELSTVEWSSGQFEPVVSVGGGDLTASAVNDQGGMLVECRTAPDATVELKVTQGDAQCVSVARSLGAATPPIVLADVDGADIVVVECEDVVVALDYQTASEPPRELWRMKGHAATGADLLGDGSRQVVFATAAPSGNARIVAVDARSGRTLWTHDFERFAEGNRAWNQGGVLFCQVGCFTTRGRHDVLATLQRSVMHSEETFLLSGSDGRELWHRARQIADRSCGGEPFAIADYNGDGFDDAASFYTHIRYVLSGPDGGDIWAEENRWPDVPVSPAYWGQPIAGVFDDSQRPSLLYCNFGGQMLGRIDADGTLIWSDAYDEAANGYPAVGDFDGDGRSEALFIGFSDGARCYNPATGEVKWTLPLGAGQSVDAAVSADIDGDQRDEAVFILAGKLYCVEVPEGTDAGAVSWSLNLPCPMSAPIVAALPADGSPGARRLSILAMGVDGCLYCIQ